MLGNDLEWKYLIWRPAQVSVCLCRVGSGEGTGVGSTVGLQKGGYPTDARCCFTVNQCLDLRISVKKLVDAAV